MTTTEPRVPLPAPTAPNERWGMDFIHDAFSSGHRFRCLTLVDLFTRECPRIDVDTSLPAARVIAALEQLASVRGLPKSIVVENGPEFISRALDIWAYRHQIQLAFIRPGKPVENAYIESFHSRFCDECLSARWFLVIPLDGGLVKKCGNGRQAAAFWDDGRTGMARPPSSRVP